jgi:UDP-N-acetylmuramate--alanine ligase
VPQPDGTVGLQHISGGGIDLSVPMRVHVIGVGGAAMSAIATILAAMGHRVSGSDLKESGGLERLRSAGVDVHVGHDAVHLGDPLPDLVAVSTAIPERNPELAEARRRDVPIATRADVLAAICATRRTAAVSGTHGKTTTSSMLALACTDGGLRPSFLVGGELNEIGGGVVWRDSPWFVVEADESDGTFVELPAEAVVVTNVEADHLDRWGSLEAIIEAFDRYLDQATGPRVVCLDEPNAAALARRHDATTYGTSPDADWRIVDAVPERVGVRFRLVHRGDDVGDVALPVPGLHNARNATAALACAAAIGADLDAARIGLARYAGVARRFQFRGEAAGVTVVDDYAHNPGKVAAVLAAARAGGWRRVVCVFQPQRYTRTATLWREFGPAFADADVLVLTEVYPANEAPIPGVTGKLLVRSTLEASPWKRVAWLPTKADVVSYLGAELRPGDLCLLCGAGDLTSWAPDVLAAVERRRQ